MTCTSILTPHERDLVDTTIDLAGARNLLGDDSIGVRVWGTANAASYCASIAHRILDRVTADASCSALAEAAAALQVLGAAVGINAQLLADTVGGYGPLYVDPRDGAPRDTIVTDTDAPTRSYVRLYATIAIGWTLDQALDFLADVEDLDGGGLLAARIDAIVGPTRCDTATIVDVADAVRSDLSLAALREAATALGNLSNALRIAGQALAIVVAA